MIQAILGYYERFLNHFSMGIGLYKLIWIFFIGSLLGCMVETIWCMLTLHRFESRKGLIFGPFSPVYGFGAVMLAVGLYPVKDARDIIIVFAGMLLGSLVEFVCAVVQEKAFGSKSWDYSDRPLNFKGKVNLLYSFFWGILSLLWVKAIYPALVDWMERIQYSQGVVWSFVIIVFLSSDAFISAAAVLRWSRRMRGQPARNALERFLDRYFTDNIMKTIYINMKFSFNDDTQNADNAPKQSKAAAEKLT